MALPRRVGARSLVGVAFLGGGIAGFGLHGPDGRSAGMARPVAASTPSAAPVSPGVAVPAALPAPLELPDAMPAIETGTPAPAEPAATLERTPLGEDEAAVHLARAWRSVAGADATPETLALLWAQWAHETGRGRRMRGYNFAGIKGNGPGGDSFVAWTREGTPKPERRLRDTFRAYSTPEGGAHDYVRLLSSRYPAAFRQAARGDVKRFVRALDLGGYFTDSDRAYSRALSSLARECLERSVSRRALEAVARGARMPAAEPTAI
jgi:hypothetical protein